MQENLENRYIQAMKITSLQHHLEPYSVPVLEMHSVPVRALPGRLHVSTCRFLRCSGPSFGSFAQLNTIGALTLPQAARPAGSRESSSRSAGPPGGVRMQVWSNPQAVQDYKGEEVYNAAAWTRQP